MSTSQQKHFIFTVTTGRSGSNFLTEILACLKGVCSVHEPQPKFHSVMRTAQLYPFVADEFLAKKKIPAVFKKLQNKSIYAESSHLFCKGFLEAWLRSDEVPVPDLICLDRDNRKTSLSLLQIGTIPGRTGRGLKYYLAPDDPGNRTRLEAHETLNDYQLCYWYCLEIEARKKYYKKLVEEVGGKCIHTSIGALKTPKGISFIQDELNLPGFSLLGERRYQKTINRVINAKTEKKRALDISEAQILGWEQALEDRVSYK